MLYKNVIRYIFTVLLIITAIWIVAKNTKHVIQTETTVVTETSYNDAS